MTTPTTRSGLPHIAVPNKSQAPLEKPASASPISTTSTASASGVSSNGSSPPVSPAEDPSREFEISMGNGNSAFKTPGAPTSAPSVSGNAPGPAAGTRSAKRARGAAAAAAAAVATAPANGSDETELDSELSERPRKRTSLVNISTDSVASEGEAATTAPTTGATAAAAATGGADLGSPHKSRSVRPVLKVAAGNGHASGDGIKSGPGLGSPRAAKPTDDAFITSSPRKINAIRKLKPFNVPVNTASGPPPAQIAKGRESISSISSIASAISNSSAASTDQAPAGGSVFARRYANVVATTGHTATAEDPSTPATTSVPSRRHTIGYTSGESSLKASPLMGARGRRASSPFRRASTPPPSQGQSALFSPLFHRATPDLLDLSQASQHSQLSQLSQGSQLRAGSPPKSPPKLLSHYSARPVSAASSRSATPAIAPVGVRAPARAGADTAAEQPEEAASQTETGSNEALSQELGAPTSARAVAMAHAQAVAQAAQLAADAAAAAIATGESSSMIMESTEEMPLSQVTGGVNGSSFYDHPASAQGLESEPLEGFAPDAPLDSSLDASYVSAAAAHHHYVNDSTTSIPEEDTEMGDYEDDFDPLAFIYTLPPLPHDVIARPAALPPKSPDTPPNSLILDLDETLVHCSTDPLPGHDLTFPVEFNGAVYTVYVRKRPHLYTFLEAVSRIFEVSVFTASQRVYADRLLDILDPAKTHIKYRMFRDHCVNVEGNYLKDLHIVGRDLARVMIVDNSPQAFGYQIDNGIPIETWYEDPNDTGLLDLIPLLEQAATLDDVRPFLKQTFDLRSLVIQAGKDSGLPRGGGSV